MRSKIQTFIIEGNLEEIKKLFPLHSTVELEDFFSYACAVGSLEVVKCFIDLGININGNQNMPLANACNYGHLDVTQLLLDNGADITADDFKAFRYACLKNKNLEIVKLLLDNGADVSASNFQALTFAHRNNCIDVINYLNNYIILKKMDDLMA